MKKFVKYLLIVIFMFIYFKGIDLFVWQHLPINSGAGVLGFSLLAMIIAIVLALITVNKIVVVFEE